MPDLGAGTHDGAQGARMAGDHWLGAELAGYRIEALIDQGGMGVVYRATHLRLHRPAALKLLAAPLATDAEYRHRFEREARLAASLDHPHIVPIYDAGYDQDVLYLAMRYIDGPTLATVIDRDAPMELARVCELLTGVAEALDTAHLAGLVHRDVTPVNILITPAQQPAQRERPYLCDFGIAKHTTTHSALTSTGQLLGSLPYCAPEQIQNQPIDGRADQYALACVAFHCLTGQPPFPAQEPSAVMFAHLHTDPPRASARYHMLPPAIDDVLARALAKHPTQRYPTCTTFLQTLRTASNTTPTPPNTKIWPPHPTPPTHTQQHSPTPTRGHPWLITLRNRLGRAYTPVLTLTATLLAAVIIGIVIMILWVTIPTPVIPSHLTATIPVTRPNGASLYLYGVAITPDGRHAYIATTDGVAVIDTASNTVTTIIPLRLSADDVAITPDGRHAYITSYFDTKVTVIDTTSNTVTTTIALPGHFHGDVAITPDGRHAYITREIDTKHSGVAVIDTASNTVTTTIPLALRYHPARLVAITPNGRHAYIAGSFDVAVIDTASNTVTTIIPLRDLAQDVAITPDGRHAYIAGDIDYRSSGVTVIDTASNTSNTVTTITIPGSGKANQVAITPDGRHAVIAGKVDDTHGTAAVIDTASNTVTTTIPLPFSDARQVAITPDGRRAYITHREGGVSVIEIGG